VVITSATNEFVTRPIAAAFGVQELLATELARDAQGWFTGEIDGIPNMREGVVRMDAWLAARGCLERRGGHLLQRLHERRAPA
jgi:phosphoserine phosphatase